MSVARGTMVGMSDPVGRLAAVSLDCPDPDRLAEFYSALLGLKEVVAAPDRSVIAVADQHWCLTMMKVDDHVPPQWPGGPQKQQIHLDVSVDDLDASVEKAVALGARVAETQPGPDVWRVLIDPAGHPFCLTTVKID